MAKLTLHAIGIFNGYYVTGVQLISLALIVGASLTDTALEEGKLEFTYGRGIPE